MSIVATLLESVRAKRKEKFASTASEYESFVLQLAKGQQVDAERMAEVLDELDKSDSDLEADITAKQKRLTAAAKIQQLRQLERTLPKLRSEAEAAQQALNEAIERLRPLAGAAHRKVLDAENEVSQISFEQSTLRSVGVSIRIKQKQEQLAEMRRQRRELQEEYDQRTQSARHVGQYRNHVQEAEDAIAKAKEAVEAGSIAQATQQRDSAAAKVKHMEAVLETWAPKKAEIDALTKQIDALSAEIEQELMIP